MTIGNQKTLHHLKKPYTPVTEWLCTTLHELGFKTVLMNTADVWEKAHFIVASGFVNPLMTHYLPAWDFVIPGFDENPSIDKDTYSTLQTAYHDSAYEMKKDIYGQMVREYAENLWLIPISGLAYEPCWTNDRLRNLPVDVICDAVYMRAYGWYLGE